MSNSIEKQPTAEGRTMDIRRPKPNEYGIYCIQLEFGLGVFRRRYTAEVRSLYDNHRGLELVQLAIEYIYGILSADDNIGDSTCIVLEDSEGARLEVCDDHDQYENWLGELLVSSSIIGVEYRPRARFNYDDEMDIAITEDSVDAAST